MDELAPTGPVSVWEIRDGKVTETDFDPTVDLGLAKITVDQLKGGVPDVNANAFKDFLAGKDITSRTTALLNAASAIVADGNLVGNGTLAERFAEPTSWPRKPSIPARPKPCSTSGSKPPSPRRDTPYSASSDEGGLCVYMATVMAAVALCVTATRGTSVGAADVPVVPAKGDVTIRLNWWGAMPASSHDCRVTGVHRLQFVTYRARPQLRTRHARNTLVRYLSHLAYKQPTGLFA